MLGLDRVLQGNMDLMYSRRRNDSPEVANNAAAAGGGKHILNVGHGVVQGTPEGNVGVFCDAARASVYEFRENWERIDRKRTSVLI